MIPTSLGRMLEPRDYTYDDTAYVLSGEFPLPRMIARGNPWIESPIFDRLAGERFGS